MERETSVARSYGEEWETPTFEEIRVSAEATAYMGLEEDRD